MRQRHHCHVDECISIDESVYITEGGTPLYAAIETTAGAMLRKVAELANSGRTAQSYTAIISDGRPSDGAGSGRDMYGDNVSDTATHASVTSLIAGFQTAKQHIVCGVAVGGTAHSFFSQIGIPDKWIIDPERDGHAFEAAIKQVSRASRSASQGAGTFQSVANEGFGFVGNLS